MILFLSLFSPFLPRATHSAAQLRSPLGRSLPQAQVFRRAPRPASGAHKFNAKVKAATTRNHVGRKCARYSFVLVGSLAPVPCARRVRCPSFRVRASRLFLDDSESKRHVALRFPPVVPLPSSLVDAMSMCCFRKLGSCALRSKVPVDEFRR